MISEFQVHADRPAWTSTRSKRRPWPGCPSAGRWSRRKSPISRSIWGRRKRRHDRPDDHHLRRPAHGLAGGRLPGQPAKRPTPRNSQTKIRFPASLDDGGRSWSGRSHKAARRCRRHLATRSLTRQLEGSRMPRPRLRMTAGSADLFRPRAGPPAFATRRSFRAAVVNLEGLREFVRHRAGDQIAGHERIGSRRGPEESRPSGRSG